MRTSTMETDVRVHPGGWSADTNGRSQGRTDVGVEVRTPADEWEWRQASALLHDFAEWVRGVAGVDLSAEQASFARELDDLEAVYTADDADMFVAVERGLAVGIVAARYHGDRSAELKRMYVRRMARGKGIADRLASEVVNAAASRGCMSVWLETLPGPMDPAIGVYHRCGFVQTQRRGTLDRAGIIVMERAVDGGVGQP